MPPRNNKLSPEQVVELLDAYLTDEPIDSIAARFGVQPSTVVFIAKGKSWRRTNLMWRRAARAELAAEDLRAQLAAQAAKHARDFHYLGAVTVPDGSLAEILDYIEALQARYAEVCAERDALLAARTPHVR